MEAEGAQAEAGGGQRGEGGVETIVSRDSEYKSMEEVKKEGWFLRQAMKQENLALSLL